LHGIEVAVGQRKSEVRAKTSRGYQSRRTIGISADQKHIVAFAAIVAVIGEGRSIVRQGSRRWEGPS